MGKPKIGYIPIQHYQTSKPKVCEAPRHKGRGIAAYAVVAVIDERGNEIVEMVCVKCWRVFDSDMGSPNWNLMEGKEGER